MRNKISMVIILIMIGFFPIKSHSWVLQNTLLQRHKTELPLTDGSVRQETDVPAFTGIAVHGPFDVNIIFRPQQYFLSYEGNGGLMSNVHYYVKNDVLHVFTNQEFAYNGNYKVTLNIEVPCLRRLSYRGPGNVEINNMEADHFTLNLEESGYVYITGRATRFDATLSGTSRLNAKCLYARTAFVNTIELAQAEVASNGSISALAANNSDIYYYEHPDLVADYENTSGSIMRMQGLPSSSPVEGPLTPKMQPSAEMMPQYLGKGPINVGKGPIVEEFEVIK